jgi:Xaa-Pro aminopeptidase
LTATDSLTLARLDRLQELLSCSELDAVWIEISSSLRYLTGLELIADERTFGLVVPRVGEPRVLVPSLLKVQCEPGAIELVGWDDAEGPLAAIRFVLSGIRRLGVQATLPARVLFEIASVAPDVETVLDDALVPSLRRRKDEQELALLEASAEITDGVMDWLATAMIDDVSEVELAEQVRARYVGVGVEPVNPPLVLSGLNASMPHRAPSNDRIAPGSPLLVDVGCRLEGYWSDCTRVIVRGEADAEVAAALDAVHAAYEAALASARPGAMCGEVDRAARDTLASAGLGAAFVHRTGHGIGLDEHEAPFLVAGSTTELDAGDVLTIEPGVYVPGRFGVRLENVVHISDNGARELNTTPRLVVAGST